MTDASEALEKHAVADGMEFLSTGIPLRHEPLVSSRPFPGSHRRSLAAEESPPRPREVSPMS